MCRKPIFLISLVLLLALVNSAASATTFVWTNFLGDRNWDNAGNWSPLFPIGPPGSGDTALINPPPLEGPVVDCDVDVLNIHGPKHNSSSDQVMIVIADGNTILVRNDWRVANQGSGVGTLLIGGTPTINIWGDFRCADDGFGTTAVVDISGNPTINIDGQWRSADKGGFSDIDISGGIINMDGNFRIGDDGSGTIDVFGGTINVDDDWLLICRPPTSWAAFGMYGGQVNIAGDLIMIQNYGTGMAFLDMDDGTINIGDDLELPGGNGTGILSMSGGNINVAGYFRLGTAGTGQVLLCGGTIKTGAFKMGPSGTMSICCLGKLIVNDPNGSVKAKIDGYVANGWITCIDSYCSEVMVAWNGSTTTVSCQPLGRKWSQPPIPTNPISQTPNYCGWDEDSYTGDPCDDWEMVADDFPCLGSMPITAIHWWGSYENWSRYYLPEPAPVAWRIGFWSNVPEDDPCNPEDFSYPKELLWQIEAPAERVQSKWVGTDELDSDKCFRHYLKLEANEWFWQDEFLADTNDDIFWLSIAAIYDPYEFVGQYEWGWKTRPWSWMDDAVSFQLVEVNPQPGMVLDLDDNEIDPLKYAGESFDVSFELETEPNYIKHEQPFTGIREWPHYEDELSMMAREPVTVPTKWAQPPCLADPYLCMDVDATQDTMLMPWDPTHQALADDFFCTRTGLITDIRIWGSWLDDELPGDDPNNAVFTLCIYSNDPVGPNGWSEPNELLWTRDFWQGDFDVAHYSEGPQAYYRPCDGWYDPNNHQTCWLYSFYIDPCEAFVQQEGTIYWLALQAHVADERFGWKNSTEQWNDDAVWARGILPGGLVSWNELLHPETDESVDLAFEIETTELETAQSVPKNSAEVADVIVNDTGITLTLSVKDGYNITPEDAFDVIEMENFALTSSSGDPMLPHKLYDILLPPDALESTVELNIVSAKTRTLDGTYNIKPAGPDVAWVDGKRVEVWGDDRNIVDGRNVDVYQSDADFPETSVKLLLHSQMRKWKFVRVDFIPFQYNPVSGKLTLTESVEIEISYSKSLAAADVSLMADTVWEDKAASRFINYTEVRGSYDQPISSVQPSQVADYVIITTNAINTNSTKLNAFVTHKQNLGYSVLVVIRENSIDGLVGQVPNNRAEKIRQWLKDNYISMSIEYVLLIGDPSPYESGEGDIPMKMCYPRGTSNNDNNKERAPTDYFYADLTGNWDIDANQFYGQWDDDGDGTAYKGDYPVTGGVDFTPEVYVGRIPVYDANYPALDSILQKMIDYENEPAGSRSWRRSTLLPMGFQEAGYDGAPLAEQMRNDYLLSAGYSNWRMYQQGSKHTSDNSSYTSEEELRGSPNTPNVLNRWTGAGTPVIPNDFGINCWWAHGLATSAMVGYDGAAHDDGTLMDSSFCSSLDDEHPAFTYQCSCLNGHPETSNNLQYAILEQGGIATVSATRVSWFYWKVGYGQFDGSTTSSGIGYEYVDRLVQNLAAGDALYQAKSSMSPAADDKATRLMNWYVFNLYGDPALAIGVEPTGGPRVKWTQPPDETEDGIDIRCDRNDGIQRTLADDFLCITTGPITKVILWSSWSGDVKGDIQKIHLSIHSDDPCGLGGWSEPNELLWARDFAAADINETLYKTLAGYEWWWDPALGTPPFWPGDQKIWQYEITIDDSNQFIQQGDHLNPVVYWLDVYVETDPCFGFGWKTSTEHWNDDAVWSNDDGNTWNELRYPSAHPLTGDSIDLAFEIWTPREEPLVIRRLVADDWPCDQNTPITAAAWWGSYIGYRYEACQEQQMPPPVKPDYFWLTIWDDVPAGAGIAKWSQEPDPFGWDVDYSERLADDWQCAETGPVSDIHFWYSWYEDDVGVIDWIDVYIHSDDPCGPRGYSEPNEQLWSRTFMPGEFSEYWDGEGDQGWFEPDGYWERPDHINYYRVDIEDIIEPFIQQEGTIYWLEVHIATSGGLAGWKTSLDHWNDVAVWFRSFPPGWRELYDPCTSERLDLAFEINSAGETYSHPNDIIWEYKAYDYDEVLVGYDKHPEGGPRGPNEPVFRYSVRLPEEDWFSQEEPNGVYWFSVVAVYDQNTPNYDWGWTNHEHVYNDDAVAGVLDTSGDEWLWEELYDQTEVNSVDMSFILFTEPGCLCKGDVSDTTGFGPPDNKVDIGDLNYTLMAMFAVYPMGDPNGIYPIKPVPPNLECMDVSDTTGFGPPDGQVDIGDLNYVLMAMFTVYPMGDPNGIYPIPCLP